MADADNKSTIRRFVEKGSNRRNSALSQETYSADYVGHDPDRPATAQK